MGYCVAQTSLAHTYGNVASFITEYMKSIFGQDYFRTVHITSKIAYRDLSKDRTLRRELLKKRKPMLIIRPRIELFDSDSFLYDTLLTTRMTDNFYDTSFTNLQEFMLDDENGMELKFLLNRLVMNFEITIVHETLMRQLDMANFLKNRLPLERPFMLSTALESYIPRDLLSMISKDMGVPMYDKNNSPKPFLDYLNSHSMYPITYKMKNASGNDEFFRFYPSNILVKVGSLSIDDGSKRGLVSDNHQIQLTVRTEFDAAGLYYYFPKNINKITTIIGEIDVENDNNIIPFFTVNNIFDDVIAEGWSIYSSIIYQVEKNQGTDILDVSGLFTTSNTPTVFKYCLDKGIPINTFFIPMVMKNNVKLEEGQDFVMDYKTLELTTTNLDMDATYRLVFHINQKFINDTITDINNFGLEH